MAINKDTEFSVGLTATDNASPAIEKVADASEHASQEIDHLLMRVTGLNQALELLSKAYEFAKDTVKESVGAYIEQEHQLHELQLSMQIAGRYSDEAFTSFKDFASGLAATTTASYASIVSMLRLGQATGKTVDMTKKLTETAIDVAAAMHIGPEEAFNQLAGTLAGNVRGLSRFFPYLKNLSAESLRAGGAIDVLREHLGGFAKEEALSAAGQVEMLHKSFSALTKAIGEVIVILFRGEQHGGSPIMAFAIKQVRDLIKVIKSVVPIVKEFHDQMVDTITSVADTVVTFTKAAIQGFKDLYDVMTSPAFLYLSAIIAGVGITIIALLGGVGLLTGAFTSLGGAVISTFAAMGASFLTILGYVGTMIAQVALLSAETLLYVGIVAVWTAAVVGLGIGIELVVRNTNNLGEVWTLVWSSVYKWITKASIALAKFFSFAGKTDAEVAIKEMESDLQLLQKNIDDANDTLDTGFSGEAIDKLSEVFNKFQDNLKGTAKHAEDAHKEILNLGTPPNDSLMQWTQENQKALDELAKKAEDGRLASERAGMNEIAKAKIEHAQFQQSIDDQYALIKAAGLLGSAQEDVLKLIQKNSDIKFQNEIGAAIQKKIDESIKAADSAQEAAYAAGLGEVEQAERKRDLALEQIALTYKEAEANGALTASRKAQLEYAMEAQREAANITIGQIHDKQIKEIAKAVYEGMIAGAAFLATIFSGAIVDSFGSVLESIANIPETFIKAFTKIDGAIANLLQAFPRAIETVIKKIPDMAAKFVAAAPEIARVLARAIPAAAKAMADAIPAIIRVIAENAPLIIRAIADGIASLVDVVPDILTAILDNLPEIITALIRDAIPKVLESIFKAIPKLIEEIVNHIPDIIEAFVSSLIDAQAEIAVAFAETFMKYLLDPTALQRMGLRIAVGIVQGFIRGFARAFKDIIKLFGGKKFKFPIADDIADIAGKAAGELRKIIGGDTSKLFNVSDLTNGAKGIVDAAKQKIDEILAEAEEIGKTIWQSFIDAFHDGIAWIMEMGQRLWDAFAQAISNGISFIRGIGKQIWDGLMAVVNPASFVAWGQAIWSGLLIAVGDPLAFFRNLGMQIWYGFLSVADFVNQWNAAGRQIWNGLLAALDRNAVSGLGHQIAEQTLDRFNHLMGDIAQIGRNMANAFWDTFKSFNFGGLLPGGSGGGGGVLGTIASAAGWHTGGIVSARHYATGGYIDPLPLVSMVPRGLDTIPIMAQKGEMVMNKNAVARNLGTLTSMNSGGTSGQPVYNISINVRSDLDTDSVRRNILPEIERSLKRKSQDGGFVITSSGVRS